MDPIIISQVVVSGLALGGIYVLISVGLTLIFGVIRVINFAHGDFMMIGMYITFLLVHNLKWDPYASLVAVIPAIFLLAVIVYWLVIRPAQRAASFLVQVFATLGLGIALENGALLAFSPNFQTVRTLYTGAALPLGPLRLSVTSTIAFIVAMALAAALILFLRHTYQGKAMRAIAQNRDAALLMGINVDRIYLLTFALGTAMVGIAGTLLIPNWYVTPYIGFGFVLVAFVVVVLGGFGSVEGAVLAGMIVGVVETFAGFFIQTKFKEVAYFLLFILILVLRPSGLMGIKGAEEIGHK